jgi:hypothetical protein
VCILLDILQVRSTPLNIGLTDLRPQGENSQFNTRKNMGRQKTFYASDEALAAKFV